MENVGLAVPEREGCRELWGGLRQRDGTYVYSERTTELPPRIQIPADRCCLYQDTFPTSFKKPDNTRVKLWQMGTQKTLSSWGR